MKRNNLTLNEIINMRAIMEWQSCYSTYIDWPAYKTRLGKIKEAYKDADGRFYFLAIGIFPGPVEIRYHESIAAGHGN